jgi:hypothetical protein
MIYISTQSDYYVVSILGDHIEVNTVLDLPISYINEWSCSISYYNLNITSNYTLYAYDVWTPSPYLFRNIGTGLTKFSQIIIINYEMSILLIENDDLDHPVSVVHFLKHTNSLVYIILLSNITLMIGLFLYLVMISTEGEKYED